MEKLQWFKFSPADWFMGKIQRCSPETQAKFIRLCCVYWNKSGNLSVDDASFEIGQDHFEELIKNRCVFDLDQMVQIRFLDEQLGTIEKVIDDKKNAAKIGNLKRWHPEIHQQYQAKQLTLEEAIKLSQTANKPSQVIAPRSQSIATDRREDKIREEEIRKDKIRGEQKREEKKEIVLPFGSEVFAEMWSHWKSYKKKEFRFNYKSIQSEQAAVNSLVKVSNGIEQDAVKIIQNSMANGWKGFFELKNEKKNGQSVIPRPSREWLES